MAEVDEHLTNEILTKSLGDMERTLSAQNCDLRLVVRIELRILKNFSI